MENFGYSDENYLFQCPACRQHISDSQIHEHIQSCEYYIHHSSHSETYSSMNSSYDRTYHINNSLLSSDSESHYSLEASDFSSRQKQMTPSKTSSIAACPVCFNNFHNTRNSPLLLPGCGHTICKPCLKDIKTNSEKFCCPICRTHNKIDIRYLPINYALLELTEKHEPRKCKKHDLEYVAYCVDDDNVLCGVCVFEHKNHVCYLLSDPALNSVSEKKKGMIKVNIETLLGLKASWNEGMKEMDNYIKKINDCVDIHKSFLAQNEEKMIKAIKDGSKACAQELMAVAGHENLNRLHETFKQSIETLERAIISFENKLESFDKLTVAEKLESENFGKKEEYKEIPSLTPARNILDKLMVGVDYKQSIQNQKLF